METTTTTTTKKTTQAPVERVSLPVKPALASAANAAALTAAGVVAGGGVAMAAAAAAALGVGAAVKGSRKVAQARQQRRAFSTAGASTSRRGAATRVGTSGARGNGKAPTVGKKAGGVLPKVGAAGSKLGAGGKAPTAGRSAAGRSGPGAVRGATASGRSAGRAWTGGPMAGRLAHRARSVANSPARRWAAGQARKSWAQTKAAAAQTGVRTRAARKAVWGWLRKQVQRHVMGRTPAEQTAQTAAPVVLGSLRDAFEKGLLNDLINPDRRMVVRPIPRGAQTVPQTASTGGNMLPQILRQAQEFALEYDAPGALEIIHDLDEGQVSLSQSAQIFADTFRAIADVSKKKWPWDPAIVQKLNMIGECLDTAAQMAKGVVPDIEAIHEAELARLRNPGVGQEKFDLSANGYV